MPTRLSASGLVSSTFTSEGRGSGSVLAFLIFLTMGSASSGRLMRVMSDSFDFDIFLVPSRKFITRVAGPVIKGSGSGKKPSGYPARAIVLAKSVVNFLLLSGGTLRGA